MTLSRLLVDVDTILERITESQLKRYDHLQRSLRSTNVATDNKFRSTFNGYYRMQRRKQDWYDYFFSLLEREKQNRAITFRNIFEEVYQAKQRVEPSFCSKLVATIRPEMPVYDKYVRENLSLKIPKQQQPSEVRIRGFLEVYSVLEGKMNELVQDEAFQKIETVFDDRFPAYVHFTDIKKLDLLLWQDRQD